jgi:hypothetical protein
MSETQDTPKFTVINRRKLHDDDDSHPSETATATTPPPTPEAEPSQPTESPRLKLVEMPEPKTPPEAPREVDESVQAAETDAPGDLPPGPTTEESRFQKLQYDQSAERLETLVRAQNPGAPPMEKIGFEHLVQQLYLSAMMQMGAGTPEGQRPRVDILGARQTIDLMGVLQEKTAGNLTPTEKQTLDTVLYELRMTFLELTRMISMQPPTPGGAKH